MPEPLPIGEEARDDVAQLAGWKRVILYYVTVIEGACNYRQVDRP